MISRLTVGKQKGLEAVCDSRGAIAAVAIDRRSALRSLFARGMGIEPENSHREANSIQRGAEHQGLEPVESLRLSVACGAGNCLAEGPGRVRSDDIARLKKEIRPEIVQE